jgi:preprotein translocase subunit SecF
VIAALSGESSYDFMGKRRIAYAVSVVLLLVAVFAIVTRGLNFGIDFTGGTLVEVGYQDPVELGIVRGTLREAGFEDAVVQSFGTPRDVLIRLAPREGMSDIDLSNDVLDVLRAGPMGDSVDLRRIEFVGPQVGKELAEDGGLAVLYALFGILIYVTLRFEKRFSVGAVLALIHDVTITVGIFALLQLDFDLTVLAALLAVIGYSLNDTIVVYDRIRENFRKMRKGTPAHVVNVSINSMLARTLVTSFTTLLVLFALYFLGGEIIRNFALALIIGIVIGTYSSIYIASALTLALGVSKADLMPVQKEGVTEEVDSRP